MKNNLNKLRKKVVVIGGGTGTFTTLSGLRDFPFDITAIVSTADDGGSSGLLRDELGVLPPGDIRQALVALSDDSTILRELFNYRFDRGGLKGHQFGNLFLSALEKIKGSFDQAVIEVGKILSIQGQVIPVTNDNIRLFARSKNGKVIKGQHAIDEFIWSQRSPVNELWLEPNCKIHIQAKRAILEADVIVIGPGSIFTSLIPNLLVGGVREALVKTSAKIIYVSNLMTEKGQTDNFIVQDYAKTISQYLLPAKLDYVVYNKKSPSDNLLKKYRQEMERQPVLLGKDGLTKLNYSLIGANLLSRNIANNLKKSDKLAATRSLIRHDSYRLGQIIYYLSLDSDFRKLELEQII